jgi:signal transduction histidine kinase
VADHGQGIAPEDLDRIFDRFQRATGSQAQPGLGLGLFVTRHIVAAHGGTISVESDLGEGTTFTVELPRMPVHAPAGEGVGPLPGTSLTP